MPPRSKSASVLAIVELTDVYITFSLPRFASAPFVWAMKKCITPEVETLTFHIYDVAYKSATARLTCVFGGTL